MIYHLHFTDRETKIISCRDLLDPECVTWTPSLSSAGPSPLLVRCGDSVWLRSCCPCCCRVWVCVGPSPAPRFSTAPLPGLKTHRCETAFLFLHNLFHCHLAPRQRSEVSQPGWVCLPDAHSDLSGVAVCR